MVPDIAFQPGILGPEGEPVVLGADLEAQPAKTLIAQQEALVPRLIILAHDSGHVCVAGGGSVGIIPFKGPGSHPYADGQGIARNAELLGIIGHIGGRAVKQQRSTRHADFAPLGLHAVGVGGSQVLILNVRLIQVSARILNRRALTLVKGKVQQKIILLRCLRECGRKQQRQDQQHHGQSFLHLFSS